jgi:outer membrane protein OmpA-like peptidoglycan-associated protein
MKKIYLLTLLFTLSPWVWAQSVKKMLNDAKKNMEVQEYNTAIPLFDKVLEQEPTNIEALFGLGVSHLHAKHREKALPYLQQVYKANPAHHEDLKGLLAEAYQINNLFKEADKLFKEMEISLKTRLEKANRDTKELLNEKIKVCQKRIRECENGESYINSPVDAQIENVGNVVNSHFPDYAPVISADETVMVFTSRRDDTTGDCKDDADGMPCEDIYISFQQDGKWGAPKNLGSPVNSKRHDACIALSPDGKELFVYRDDARGTGDIYYSTSKDGGSKWSSLEEFKAVNSPEHETSISITSDYNTVYFASNRPGGLGGLDIWKCHKDEKGKWGKPENLGAPINTPEDEDCPFIKPDGKTLYFSSKGHTTMGGYDIFKTEIKENTYSKPENLGFPINTADNDVFFVISSNGRHGYYASPKKGGNGEEDIYVIVMPQPNMNLITARKREEDLKFNVPAIKIIEPIKVPTTETKKEPHSLLRGKVTDKSSKMPLEADLVIVDMESNETLTDHRTHAVSGEYKQDPIPEGHTYLVRAEKQGYLFDSQTITIPKSDKDQEFVVDLELEKLQKGAKTRLRVYFDFDKATLRKESTPELERFVTFLKKYPNAKVEIAGHTDNIGTDQKNKILSGQRSKMVMDYLIEKGIAPERLRSQGYGFHKPVAPNQKPDGTDNPEGRQMNRRTECEIVEF